MGAWSHQNSGWRVGDACRAPAGASDGSAGSRCRMAECRSCAGKLAESSIRGTKTASMPSIAQVAPELDTMNWLTKQQLVSQPRLDSLLWARPEAIVIRVRALAPTLHPEADYLLPLRAPAIGEANDNFKGACLPPLPASARITLPLLCARPARAHVRAFLLCLHPRFRGSSATALASAPCEPSTPPFPPQPPRPPPPVLPPVLAPLPPS